MGWLGREKTVCSAGGYPEPKDSEHMAHRDSVALSCDHSVEELDSGQPGICFPLPLPTPWLLTLLPPHSQAPPFLLFPPPDIHLAL